MYGPAKLFGLIFPEIQKKTKDLPLLCFSNNLLQILGNVQYIIRRKGYLEI